MSDYPYAEKDRLEEPCHYMYTPFQGYSLISKFKGNRSKWISKIEALYKSSNILENIEREVVDLRLKKLILNEFVYGADSKNI